MLEFLKILFDWAQITAAGPDAVVYFLMATIGTLLFMIRLALALMAGGDFDMDMDVEDGGLGHGDGAFTVFSLLSVLAFFMGAGWMGLAARFDFRLGGPMSAILASAFGFGMMLLASGMMFLTRRLNQDKDYDIETAVGRTARVYLPIPEKGKGMGQVQVTISGRRKVLPAISAGPAFESFSEVTVQSVMDDETLIVKPMTDSL